MTAKTNVPVGVLASQTVCVIFEWEIVIAIIPYFLKLI